MSEPKPLIDKIKEGILKSGFPLEMEIIKKLRKLDWFTTFGHFYTDFETGKVREMDIVAVKVINSIKIELYIECKKSADKQVVLYAPTNRESYALYQDWFKTETRIKDDDNLKYSPYLNILDSFWEAGLPNNKTTVADRIIITSGNKVTEDNVKYISAINGVIKKYLLDKYRTANNQERQLSLFQFVFDGKMFFLTNSEESSFDIKEIQNGVFRYRPKFALHDENNELLEFLNKRNNNYVIELVTAEHFIDYIQSLEEDLNSINKTKLNEWGGAASDFPF